MANLRHHADIRFVPMGTGEGVVDAGEAAAETEEGGGTQGGEVEAPPSPWKARSAAGDPRGHRDQG